MRKNYFTSAISILVICILFSSCSSMNLLTMSVTEPAPVYVSSDIKTIGIVDRSLAVEKNEKLDKLDRILSIEGKDLDKNGAKESVIGLFEELSNNTRFTEVKIIDSLDIRSPGLGIFPAPLSWDTIEKICSENNVDALFVLAFYDTDAKVNYQIVPIEINGPLGIKIPAVEHHAAMSTLIKTGWRIYDPINKLILDEHIMTENVVSTGVGINPLKALDAIMGRKEGVMQGSNNIGHNYAFRILPYRIRVSRHYYVRGTDNFKIGKRRAQTGDWNGAAEFWEKEVSNPKRKVAGRAYYNMAIINEINGDLLTAIDWASKSYTDYKNKKALQYLNVLKYRNQRNNQLKQETQE